MLLIGAGLLIKSLVRLQNVSPGFQAENVLSMRLGLSGKKFANNQQAVQELDDILDRVRRVPGVNAAGSIQWPPLSGLLSATSFYVDGTPVPRPGEEPVTMVSIITPGYFSAMRIPLVKGRVFDQRDRAGTPLVTVVNQALVRQYFPNQDPIGQRVFVSWGRKTPYEIVGVVADVRHQGLNVDVMPGVYFANAQEPETNATVMLRTDRDPLSLARGVQDAIHARDADLAIADVQPLERYVSKSIASPRFQSFLLGSFAGLALLLAAIGIYGVMAYSVAQRTHEIGVRMALGAERNQVMRMVVRQALALSLIGAAAGLAGALVLTRFLKTLLFDVSTTDLATFAVVPFVLCIVAMAASWIPALRATRVDPMIALRYE
jgi:putative ABC transport system permease protein